MSELAKRLAAVPLTWAGCADPTRHLHATPARDPDYDALAAEALAYVRERLDREKVADIIGEIAGETDYEMRLADLAAADAILALLADDGSGAR